MPYLRRLPPFALAVLLALAAAAPASAAGGPTPEPVPLDAGWRFRPDPGNLGTLSGWQTGAGDDAAWQAVSVPHVFDPRPLDDLFGGTVGWYRVRFTVPAAPPGFSWSIRFEQVRRIAQVWLNGRPLGTNRDPYTPFELPTRGIRPGAPNVLVVRVDNRKGREPREGWWNWGGITRPVTLVPRGRVVMGDLGLLPRLRCAGARCRASVIADGVLRNRTNGPIEPRVAVWLRSPAGVVTQKTVRVRPLAAGESARVLFGVPVSGEPELWSPDRPRLYSAIVHTRVDGQTEQVDRLRIGLRSVRVRDGYLTLNGRPLQLRGASIQEDVEGRGPALTDADIERIVADLRAVGANVTRAHYLLNERLLERLDEEGILVWSQAPVYHRDALLRTPVGRARALDTLRRTILAARNHPSVITHSVANELSPTPDAVPATRRWIEDAVGLARNLDPTLPVSIDLLSYPGFARQATYDRFDMLGINNYFGWYEGKPDHPTADFDDLRPYLRTMRARYPDKAIVMTEFGAEATFDGPPNVKETFAFQSDYLRRTLDAVDDLGFLSGAIYWTLREFAVKPRWDGGAKRTDVERDGIHNKGLITYDGERKPAYDVARTEFSSTPLYRATTPVPGDPALRAQRRRSR